MRLKAATVDLIRELGPLHRQPRLVIVRIGEVFAFVIGKAPMRLGQQRQISGRVGSFGCRAASVDFGIRRAFRPNRRYFFCNDAVSDSMDARTSLIRSFLTNGSRKNRSTVALKSAESSYGTMCVAFGKMAS